MNKLNLIITLTLLCFSCGNTKSTDILNERIEQDIVSSYSSCREILSTHLSKAVKEGAITEKEKEAILKLSDEKDQQSIKELEQGSSFTQSATCATIQCWLDELQKPSLVNYFLVVDEYEWNANLDDFTKVASKTISDKRIIDISSDSSSVELFFIMGNDTISVLTRVEQIVQAEELTVLYLIDKDDYPYLLEFNIEGNYSLYYKYKNDGSGYNGFQGGERLKYTNK